MGLNKRNIGGKRMNEEELKKEICAHCGKEKKYHYEVPVLEGEKPIFECDIVRDDCNKNYRFKKLKQSLKGEVGK